LRNYLVILLDNTLASPHHLTNPGICTGVSSSIAPNMSSQRSVPWRAFRHISASEGLSQKALTVRPEND